jgi:hypothetical protein
MKCPNCQDGHLLANGKAADGYPMEECDVCRTFALVPIEGREPPVRMFLRALHDCGSEPSIVGTSSSMLGHAVICCVDGEIFIQAVQER